MKKGSRIALPETCKELNAAVRDRIERGLSDDIVDIKGRILRDERVGLFLRLSIYFDDGDFIDIDTQEANAIVRQRATH